MAGMIVTSVEHSFDSEGISMEDALIEIIKGRVINLLKDKDNENEENRGDVA